MDRRAPAPTPGYRQICDFAAQLARREGVEETLVELIYYPAHASPPAGERGRFMNWAARIREQAAAILKEQMAALPRPRIRRRRRVSLKPVRTWTWTRKNNVRARPRRRNFLPPTRSDERPPTAAPPCRGAEHPAQRPGRRDRERLVFYSLLFDNRIAV